MADTPLDDGVARGAVVVGVVVAFHPDQAVLGALLESLATQVASSIVVDNTPGGAPGLPDDAVVLGRNAGLARGLNVGIEEALRRGATHVLLCDQDSLPAPGMVQALLAAQAQLLRCGCAVAAVGPTYADLHSGRMRACKVRGSYLPRYVHLHAGDAPAEVLTLISAGTLIRRETIDEVGPMREDLFIDRVDTEWCLRATRRGASLYVVPGASLLQRMGEGALRLPGGVSISVYGPDRIYYQVRNLIALSRDGSLSPGVAIAGAANALLSVVVSLIVGPRRGTVARLALRAVSDGVRGRLGALGD